MVKKYMLIFVASLFLAACGIDQNSGKETSTSNSTTNAPTEKNDLPVGTAESLSDYFMPDNSIAQYKGEGNEYASYTLTTQHLYDNYVATYEDNGGTVVQKIYYIQDHKISLIAKNTEAYEAKLPSLDELKSMKEIEVYMATPLEVGTEFNGWKITSTTETLKTDHQLFEDVIVIEKTDEQGFMNRKYFAKNFGEIKREFIMQEDDKQSTVTSTIENVS